MKVYCSQRCSSVCDLIVVNVQMPKEKRRKLTQVYHFHCCRVTSGLTVSYTGHVGEGSRAQSVPCKTKKAGQTARQSGVKVRTKAKRNTVMVNCELLESTLCHLLFTLPRALKSSVFDHVCLRKAYSPHAYCILIGKLYNDATYIHVASCTSYLVVVYFLSRCSRTIT